MMVYFQYLNFFFKHNYRGLCTESYHLRDLGTMKRDCYVPPQHSGVYYQQRERISGKQHDLVGEHISGLGQQQTNAVESASYTGERAEWFLVYKRVQIKGLPWRGEYFIISFQHSRYERHVCTPALAHILRPINTSWDGLIGRHNFQQIWSLWWMLRKKRLNTNCLF